MKSIVFFMLLFVLPYTGFSQATSKEAQPSVEFSNMVDSYLDYSVPVISVNDFKEIKDNVIILDAREEQEFLVGHIEGAQRIGYDKPNLELLKSLNKRKTVVVYCSIGYRSEKIGEILQKEGFRNVLNLYGSIFEWVNQGNTIVDKEGKTTTRIHTYNKKWGKWMMNDSYEKVN